ncbi:uncharacterized protein PHACADRAFT_249040 [Phanerochaete carnosa HHB-10118-sp]|uniref:Uncharacterized protein n=1 Tax=Phanerochaete carnosa (strain HHB-10118-sp) TaxID=650164 RepID=K5V824_PHACS|nr:uncharacterized protein PHACADRAFT_249040 [Phanerochaete carnosa HHB-10118-sp]EKM58921.1 hypothetical protein PHACADRAFT_249040 [Phanerochaete carnosa HHB-10118-sp]
MKNDLVNETFACRNAVSESDYKHVSRMYRKGTRQVQYADFNYVAYNRELYDALKEQQKEDDGVGTSQTQPTKRKHDGQAGEWQARKRARV